MTRIRLLMFTALLLGWGYPSPIQAEQIRLDLTNVDPGLSVKVKLQRDDGSFKSINTKAGVFNWTIDNNDASQTTRFGPNGTVLQSFCIELLQYAADNTLYDIVPLTSAPSPGQNTGDYTTDNPDGPMSALDAVMLQRLWGTYRDQVTDDQSAAAFQLSVWEVVFDGGLDLLDGSYFVSRIDGQSQGHDDFDDVYSLAQSWLDTLDDPTLTREHNLRAISSPTRQDQLIVDPVPAPPALVLFALGLGGICCQRWRKKGLGSGSRQPA